MCVIGDLGTLYFSAKWLLREEAISDDKDEWEGPLANNDSTWQKCPHLPTHLASSWIAVKRNENIIVLLPIKLSEFPIIAS